MNWPTENYDIFYADPPWSYRGRDQFGFKGDVGESSGGAVKHYKTMDVRDIAKLPVGEIAKPDSLLFLWATGPLMKDAFFVMESWGFPFVQVAFVWDKECTNPGYYTLTQCEFVLVGKKGRIPKPRGSRKERQLVREIRGEHSVKPNEVRDRIKKMFPGQKCLELFARQFYPGWAAYGDELRQKFLQEPQVTL